MSTVCPVYDRLHKNFPDREDISPHSLRKSAYSGYTNKINDTSVIFIALYVYVFFVISPLFIKNLCRL